MSFLIEFNRRVETEEKHGCIIETCAYKWYELDREMLPAKLTYFFVGIKEATYIPIYVMFLTSIGLVPTQAGIVASMLYLGITLGSVLIGALADAKKIHKQMLILSCVCTSVLFLSKPIIASYLSNTRCPLQDSKQNTTIYSEIYELKPKKCLFYVITILAFLSNFFNGAVISLVDAGVLRQIKQSKRTPTFGNQQAFTSIGFAAGAIVSNTTIGTFQSDKFSCYSFSILMFCSFNICLLASTYVIYSKLTNKVATESKNYYQDVKKVLFRWDTLIFLLNVLMHGICIGIYWSFFLLYLDNLNISKLLRGICFAAASISGLFSFLTADWLINTLQGTWNAMIFTSFTWAVRALSLVYATNPYIIIILQFVFHGWSYPLFVITMASHLRIGNPPGIYLTLVSICNALMYGVGIVIANIAGAYVYQVYGILNLYKISYIACIIWFLLQIISVFFIKKYKVNSSVENNLVIR